MTIPALLAAVTIDVVIHDGKSHDRTTGAAANTAAIASAGPPPPPLDGQICQVALTPVALILAVLPRAIQGMVARPKTVPPTVQKGQNEN